MAPVRNEEKIKQSEATDSKTSSNDAHLWISDMTSGNDKRPELRAVTYRKKTELLQSGNLTKHFSAFAQARLSAAWRLL
ncbi:hypothetical protein ACTABV_02605 [Pseudomonas fragariae (ex Marin et al. 2024)]|uniref:hypothetical protein n=1 Tax=Pseudomonas fragariae (ex Marin et al. 2024) TaxID=3080056 RepID=UPI003F824BBC